MLPMLNHHANHLILLNCWPMGRKSSSKLFYPILIQPDLICQSFRESFELYLTLTTFSISPLSFTKVLEILSFCFFILNIHTLHLHLLLMVNFNCLLSVSQLLSKQRRKGAQWGATWFGLFFCSCFAFKIFSEIPRDTL